MYFFIDEFFEKDNCLNLVGWTSGETADYPTEFHVFLGNREVPAEVTRGRRPDVGYAYHGDPTKYDYGYFLRIPDVKKRMYRIVVEERDGEKVLDRIEKKMSVPLIPAIRRYKKFRADLLQFRRKVDHYLRRDYHTYTYWFHHVRITPTELSEQRKQHFSREPLISILTPVYRTKERYLREMLSSVLKQSYQNFELCIVNADPSDQKVNTVLAEYTALDPRIRVENLAENLGISENTNAALRMAKGEFIAMLDHDDTIEPDALFEYVKLLNEKPDTDILYCDEDKMRDQTDYYYYPNFKPDYNPDMLYHNNYICHMLMLRKNLMVELSGFRKEFDGAQDYDLVLRALEKTDRIEHVRKVLYHWRSAGGSTAKKGEKKDYAQDNGAKALNETFLRRGLSAEAEKSDIAGWYKNRLTIRTNPLVSVIIPNKDHIDFLRPCIESLQNKCSYKNLEIVIVENNSTEEETFAYYGEVQKQYPNIVLLHYEGSFNYSRINNFGVQASHGELILLLNNDTEVISPDLFENMIWYLERDEVGMVGARLLYADNTVQHAGVLTGAGGLADHMFKGFPKGKPGYMCRSITTHDVSAVTAACLMVKRSVYDSVGGLDEGFEVAFNDVDFCLKVREKGYLIVYDAEAQLYHYESKSRGAENTPAKFLRFSGEASRISDKWKILVDYYDPYYNPNMSYLDYFNPDIAQVGKREQEQMARRAAASQL
ncbi:MAG: glycosyltransferase family 2 protein [Lachnospiraceae bacterium]|nr:glycosyltransferase family 2 protein [Lachnospiraceae bacterium]